MLWLVLVYFTLAVLVAALVLLPGFRDKLLAKLSALGQWARRRLHAASSASSAGLRGAVASGSLRANSAVARGRRNKWLLLGTAALLLTGPLLAYVLRNQIRLEGFEQNTEQINPQIAALLAGERLVAPAPLPPEVFTTLEVEQIRPLLASADRKWDLMDPEFVQRLLLVFKLMRERYGYDMALLEGYRSPERQNLLANMGTGVTNARAFQSYHQFGLASDCAFYRDGHLVISEKDAWALRGYRLFGETAESLGLVWGGRWKLMDLGHVELRRPGVIPR